MGVVYAPFALLRCFLCLFAFLLLGGVDERGTSLLGCVYICRRCRCRAFFKTEKGEKKASEDPTTLAEIPLPYSTIAWRCVHPFLESSKTVLGNGVR